MYRSLQRLAKLPPEVRLFPAHEYTLANARFAAHAEPENRDVTERLDHTAELREAGAITLPTTVALELETNPFVRASNVEEFARLRADKDSFRS
jgi:hydroxyacylglutathione hydrolase